MSTTTHQGAVGAETMTAGPGDLLYRSEWETTRTITHEEAHEIARRLIASHFNRTDCETARASIPANPDRDDDLLINSYIKQQARKEATPATRTDGGMTAGEVACRAWRQEQPRHFLNDAARQKWERIADAVGAAPSEAAKDVLAERRRQVTAEGWTPEHDDTHSRGEMAQAAACYALPQAQRLCLDARDNRPILSHLWPWDQSWWKSTDRRRDLVKAGALILAEIERMDRANGATGQSVDQEATPAQPAGAVPDGLRALLDRMAKASQFLAEFPPDGLVRGDLYVAAKNEGQGTGWRYVCSGIGVSDLDAAASLLAAHPAGQSAGSGAEEVPAGLPQEVYRALMLVYEGVENIEQIASYAREYAAYLIRTTPAPDSIRTGDEGTETPWKTGQSGYAREAVVIETDDQIVEVGVTYQGRIDLIIHNRASECSDAFEDLTARLSAKDASAVVAALVEAGAARPAAPEAQGAWLPISTAPRNDTLVMLGWWCDVGGDPRWIAVAGWYEAGPADQCWYAAYDEERVEPTHWHPVPAPPASSGQGGR